MGFSLINHPALGYPHSWPTWASAGDSFSSTSCIIFCAAVRCTNSLSVSTVWTHSGDGDGECCENGDWMGPTWVTTRYPRQIGCDAIEFGDVKQETMGILVTTINKKKREAKRAGPFGGPTSLFWVMKARFLLIHISKSIVCTHQIESPFSSAEIWIAPTELRVVYTSKSLGLLLSKLCGIKPGLAEGSTPMQHENQFRFVHNPYNASIDYTDVRHKASVSFSIEKWSQILQNRHVQGR